MKKKTALLFFLFVIMSLQLSASDFSINFGINHSWLTYPGLSSLENEFHPNYSLGINLDQAIFPNTKLSYGLRFFKVGRYDKIQFNDIQETINVNHTYITLPIKVEYQVIENIIPFINIEPGIQLYSKLEHTNSLGLNDERTITNEMNKFNVFTGFGVKYLFNIYGQNLSISGLLNFGLLRISKDRQFDVQGTSSHGWADWRAREILINFEYHLGI